MPAILDNTLLFQKAKQISFSWPRLLNLISLTARKIHILNLPDKHTLALSKVIKIDVTPERWGLVNQTKLGVFTQICRDVPCFLCHFIDARFRCLLQNHLSINKKLSVNRSISLNATCTNQELEVFCIKQKTGWRHCTLRTVTLHSASRIIGTGRFSKVPIQ